MIGELASGATSANDQGAIHPAGPHQASVVYMGRASFRMEAVARGAGGGEGVVLPIEPMATPPFGTVDPRAAADRRAREQAFANTRRESSWVEQLRATRPRSSGWMLRLRALRVAPSLMKICAVGALAFAAGFVARGPRRPAPATQAPLAVAEPAAQPSALQPPAPTPTPPAALPQVQPPPAMASVPGPAAARTAAARIVTQRKTIAAGPVRAAKKRGQRRASEDRGGRDQR
jgi:hypothetical protein